ncbi:hypothetical protein LEP1GSC021_2427 [Leptospira noguchii str. 1993005606]|uniref:Uncharacterized protein n=1 Tax=Leptospira noguchii str. 2007001578 TaxID=1049974 RepID=A0ABN0IVP2_9LEPT|nr:hypothetical protein LEP1GSC035_0428 [Leptospira noguchii str. 2007001578]EPE83014.1 hypothetical protein LEP1GSC021_2427 [Leptospira noguchii str. 1993005606]
MSYHPKCGKLKRLASTVARGTQQNALYEIVKLKNIII